MVCVSLVRPADQGAAWCAPPRSAPKNLFLVLEIVMRFGVSREAVLRNASYLSVGGVLPRIRCVGTHDQQFRSGSDNGKLIITAGVDFADDGRLPTKLP
jgi:hypothetical protein